MASRPVQRRRRHQRAEGGVQLDGVGRYWPDDPRLMGDIVPCAGIWRTFAASQQCHRGAESAGDQPEFEYHRQLRCRRWFRRL